MPIQVGDQLPTASFMTMTPDGPKPVGSDELFRGKTVALFAVPGAFTPTCSVKHLPGFRDKAQELKSKGVDVIAGVAVNDVFVMGAWARAENVGEDVVLLSDGNGEFTRAIGLEMDASRFGMGTRSQRYSMLVEDGVVRQLNVEQPGKFEVSNAETLLGQLA